MDWGRKHLVDFNATKTTLFIWQVEWLWCYKCANGCASPWWKSSLKILSFSSKLWNKLASKKTGTFVRKLIEVYFLSLSLYTVTSMRATCTYRGFSGTKLRARKSIKSLLSSTWMLFKVASCFCVWKQIISGTRSDIHDLLQQRSCC